MRKADISRLSAGARRQIALANLERARAEAARVQAPAVRSNARVAKSKYGNKPCVIDGRRFASQAEGRRYVQLKHLQETGAISGLTMQPVYRLEAGGILICRYIADFRYLDRNGRLVVEDVKGAKGGKPLLTPLFRLKRKLLKAFLNIDIKVVLA